MMAEETKCQKHLFDNILDFEKPVDFCRLSKVILEVFFKHSFLIYLDPVFAAFYFF